MIEYLTNPWFYICILGVTTAIIYAIVSWQEEAKK